MSLNKLSVLIWFYSYCFVNSDQEVAQTKAAHCALQCCYRANVRDMQIDPNILC